MEDLGGVFFSLFDTDVDVLVDGGADAGYVRRCLAVIADMPKGLEDQLRAATSRYRKANRRFWSVLRIGDVFGSVSPECITVGPCPDGVEEQVAFSVELECSWDEEHGLEWVVRDDTVVYVGPMLGYGPWDDYQGVTPNYAI